MKNSLASLIDFGTRQVEEEGVARPGRDPVPRPRVVVMLGGPPPEKEGVAASGTRSRVRISYDRFLLVYSGKASARDVINMGLQRKVSESSLSLYKAIRSTASYVLVVSGVSRPCVPTVGSTESDRSRIMFGPLC